MRKKPLLREPFVKWV
jgi:hypothetical protein